MAEIDPEILAALPIFPLPRTVLMPGALLPLHVFEPRYRELIAWCLNNHRTIGIATLRPGFEDDYYGAPPVFPEVGIGELVAHQPFPDGRSNVVVQYVGRATVLEEVETEHPFRVVKVETSEDVATGRERALGALRMLVLQLGTFSPDAAEEARRLVDLDGMDMVDALARKLLEDPDDRRAYLRSDSDVDRIRTVQARLAGFLAMADPVASA